MTDDPKQTKCAECPLQKQDCFRDFEAGEVEFIATFKKGELRADAGATVLVEGSHSAHLFTVLSGWAFRYKTLPDGRRQILNFVLPGDLVGLQGSLQGEMEHSVEALSPMVLCIFERKSLRKIFENYPELAFDLTWMASREETILDENLLSVGRRSALERVAYLLALIYQRAKSVGMITGKKVPTPITQHLLADTLGLSVVHTNKTLRKLSDRKIIHWLDRGCEILDEEKLLNLARWEGLIDKPRPFI